MNAIRRAASLLILVIGAGLFGVAIQATLATAQSTSYLGVALLFTGLAGGALAGSLDLWQSAVQIESNAV